MKLNHKEFRIGNLVEYDGRVFEIDSVSEVLPTLNTIEFGIGVVDWNNLKPIPLTEDWLVRFGGEKLPYHNILNSIFFKVGRNRIVSVGNVGTPNEMIWLCQVNATNDKIIDDLICLRNYDYDGYTPVHTFQNLIHALTGTELTLTDK